jgi:hypothetical protein
MPCESFTTYGLDVTGPTHDDGDRRGAAEVECEIFDDESPDFERSR